MYILIKNHLPPPYPEKSVYITATHKDSNKQIYSKD